MDLDSFEDDPLICARQVLESYSAHHERPFPVDPFKIIRSFGVVYQMAVFHDEGLEGFYLPAEDSDDIDIIVIRVNSRITRQRFTAAHELWHYLKDNNQAKENVRSTRDNEKAANSFAAELLAPIEELKKLAFGERSSDGFVDFDKALKIAEYFGVSFQSCVYSLNSIGLISEGEERALLNKRIHDYNADEKRRDLGIPIGSNLLVGQMVDSYYFGLGLPEPVVRKAYRTDLLFNESRIERLGLNAEEVGEAVADISLKGKDSAYCKSASKHIREIAGHVKMCEYIDEGENAPDLYEIFELHKQLYRYAEYPEYAGSVRTDDRHVKSLTNSPYGSACEIVSYTMIWPELHLLSREVGQLVADEKALSNSEYICRASRIHHRLTQIHPFSDGNGRCARGFHNILMRHKGFPPMRLDVVGCEEYYTCLEEADLENGFEGLECLFMLQELVADARLHQSFLAEIPE